MRTVAICVLVVLLTSACGSAANMVASSPKESGSTTGAQTPSSTPSVAPSPDGKAPDRGIPRIVGEVGAFSSPSHNIGCTVTKSAARCDIEVHSYEAPDEPDGCAGAWGRSLRVGDGRAAFVCVTDSTLGAKHVLEYGTSTVVGNYGCTSRRTGVTCMNLETDHGFKISRADVSVF